VIYRKRGAVARWENGTLIRVAETGVAIERGEVFECHPERSEGPPSIEPPPHIHVEGNVERLILTSGVAEHEYGDIRWREETKRLHLSLTHKKERVLIDQADFDTTHIARVAEALTRMGEERAAPPRLRLAKNVTAALIPWLAGIAPPNVRLIQTAGGKDGYGDDVLEHTANWFRPSYRVRPVQAPMNLRLECNVTAIDENRPQAIALLRPVDGLTLRVLIEDGPRVYPAVVRVTRIDAVANERTFYPYGAGSFGAEMML
jgi:hypothetical protein